MDNKDRSDDLESFVEVYAPLPVNTSSHAIDQNIYVAEVFDSNETVEFESEVEAITKAVRTWDTVMEE